MEIEQDRWVRGREPAGEQDTVTEQPFRVPPVRREAAGCAAEDVAAEAADEVGGICIRQPA